MKSWPRKREYAWMAIAGALFLHLMVLGPIDYEAASVTAKIVEEEGARRASAAGGTPPWPVVGDPRELPQRKLSHPLRCLPPKSEWILQVRDGWVPGATRETSPKCVNADLRSHRYVQ